MQPSSLPTYIIDSLARCARRAFDGPQAKVVLGVEKQLDQLVGARWYLLIPNPISTITTLLGATLTRMGHPISADTVRTELVKLGFSRQSNRKADEGSKHPDRNAQFEYINAKVVAAQAQQQPVVSVDTKKKELINFKNGGTDYRPKGDPRRVNVHDFEDKKLGKVVPYGVYDVTANAGFVSVGITSDTAEFAVQSIRCWRERMGRQRYPNARELTIMADCGGSNGARVRLWKLEPCYPVVTHTPYM